MLRTKAEPQADGTYKITGAKIFISAGEHDMAENIIHLVLARLPDAPAGSKGISLFVVPKFNVNADGSLGLAQRHLLRGPGAQDGHPRQRHRADRAGRRQRHAGGPAQQGPGRHVRHDERGPPGRGQPVPGPDRSGLPERRGLRQGPPADARAERPQGPGQAGRPHHRAPRCAQDAADRPRLRRRRSHAAGLHRAAARQGAQERRRGRAQGMPTPKSRC